MTHSTSIARIALYTTLQCGVDVTADRRDIRRSELIDIRNEGSMHLITRVEDLPRTSNVRTQLIALWITGVSLVILAIAYIAFPGFWPPMSPQLSAADVATFYRDNTATIRFSMVTFNLCGIMLLPLFSVVVVQMKRMTTQNQVFAYVYLSATVSGATIFALADIFFATAAFRPNRDPDLILVLNDLGWIVFVAPADDALMNERLTPSVEPGLVTQ